MAETNKQLNKIVQPLTVGIRADIVRHAAIGGGVSRTHAAILLHHIDLLKQLLEEVITYGYDWGDEEWTTFINAALMLLDERTVRTSKHLYAKNTKP